MTIHVWVVVSGRLVRCAAAAPCRRLRLSRKRPTLALSLCRSCSLIGRDSSSLGEATSTVTTSMSLVPRTESPKTARGVGGEDFQHCPARQGSRFSHVGFDVTRLLIHRKPASAPFAKSGRVMYDRLARRARHERPPRRRLFLANVLADRVQIVPEARRQFIPYSMNLFHDWIAPHFSGDSGGRGGRSHYSPIPTPWPPRDQNLNTVPSLFAPPWAVVP
jgi:hypothetical protein